MSGFRFNFSDNTDIEEHKSAVKENILWYESEEIFVNDTQRKNLDEIAVQANMFTYKDIEIGHIVVNKAIEHINKNVQTNVIGLAEKEHSDLVSGTYEGGLKIWECTNDLIQYLEDMKERLELKNKNIMDLGCGVGILGIYGLLNGAKHVTFQDYNKEILEYVTIYNVLLNTEDDNEIDISKCNFYSGDWTSFNKKLSSNIKYDFILSSETIYNESNYEKLIEILSQRLCQNGIAFIAAKSHYFGVGGGIRQFENSINKTGKFLIESCWKTNDGINREILKITNKL